MIKKKKSPTPATSSSRSALVKASPRPTPIAKGKAPLSKKRKTPEPDMPGPYDGLGPQEMHAKSMTLISMAQDILLKIAEDSLNKANKLKETHVDLTKLSLAKDATSWLCAKRTIGWKRS
ncbi:hypothetical protein Hdeb2414_s0439g00894031 [Helianthus debilis subsp. tardiflorus]